MHATDNSLMHRWDKFSPQLGDREKSAHACHREELRLPYVPDHRSPFWKKGVRINSERAMLSNGWAEGEQMSSE